MNYSGPLELIHHSFEAIRCTASERSLVYTTLEERSRFRKISLPLIYLRKFLYCDCSSTQFISWSRRNEPTKPPVIYRGEHKADDEVGSNPKEDVI